MCGVRRMGECWDVSAVCVGAVLGDAPRPSPSFEQGLGLVKPNTGVVEGENWCFLLVLRAILTKPCEGKRCYRYKITELVKRHNSPVVHTIERNWEFLDQFLTATDLLCYFQAVTKSLHPPSVKHVSGSMYLIQLLLSKLNIKELLCYHRIKPYHTFSL